MSSAFSPAAHDVTATSCIFVYWQAWKSCADISLSSRTVLSLEQRFWLCCKETAEMFTPSLIVSSALLKCNTGGNSKLGYLPVGGKPAQTPEV